MNKKKKNKQNTPAADNNNRTVRTNDVHTRALKMFRVERGISTTVTQNAQSSSSRHTIHTDTVPVSHNAHTVNRFSWPSMLFYIILCYRRDAYVETTKAHRPCSSLSLSLTLSLTHANSISLSLDCTLSVWWIF